MYVMMTYICFFAIEETKNLNIFDGIYITVIGGLGMIVPSQGGIGSYHLAVKIGLVGIGIAVQPALLFAFAVHTAQTLMTIVFGIVSSLLLLSHKKMSKSLEILNSKILDKERLLVKLTDWKEENKKLFSLMVVLI